MNHTDNKEETAHAPVVGLDAEPLAHSPDPTSKQRPHDGRATHDPQSSA